MSIYAHPDFALPSTGASGGPCDDCHDDVGDLAYTVETSCETIRDESKAPGYQFSFRRTTVTLCAVCTENLIEAAWKKRNQYSLDEWCPPVERASPCAFGCGRLAGCHCPPEKEKD